MKCNFEKFCILFIPKLILFGVNNEKLRNISMFENLFTILGVTIFGTPYTLSLLIILLHTTQKVVFPKYEPIHGEWLALALSP